MAPRTSSGATARERRQSWFSLCLFIASAAYLYQVRTTWLPLVPEWASTSLSSFTPASFFSAAPSDPSTSPASSSSAANATPSSAKADPRSVAVAAGTYLNYLALANAEAAKLRAAYDRIGSQYKHYGDKLHYSQKLQNLTIANEANALVTARIARRAIASLGLDETHVKARTEGSMFRVREAFQHYERDWTEVGRAERDVVFEPILRVLRDEVPAERRKGVKVLVPGSGLGRLAWEISELGYTAIANEFSNYMNLALRFLLDPTTTPSPDVHAVHPWAHRFSHQRSNTDLFRSVAFPDVTPRLNGRFHILEGDFFTIKPPAPRPTAQTVAVGAAGYDYIVTLFFIDTSTNVSANLQKIYELLKPGGKWINLGPLLWAEGGSVGLQLSLDEVVALAGLVGFEGIEDQRKEVRCEYTADRRGMFQRVYDAQFWVARKPHAA